MDQTFGSQLTGAVTLHVRTPPVANAGRVTIRGRVDRDGWLFRFSERAGELHISALRSPLSALWVAPSVADGTRYASPVHFTQTAAGTWRGTIMPRENRAFMTMHVERDSDGGVRAFLRDPLANLGLRFRLMRVVVRGKVVLFKSAKAGTLRADLAESGQEFALHVDELGLPPLRFHRRVATIYSPREAYREPLDTGDGWPIASAAAVGIASDALSRLTHEIANAPVTGPQSPAVASLAIARHGKLVFDHYFDGFDESMLHDTRSAGKTYADVVAGAAILARAKLRDSTSLLSLFPQYAEIPDEPRKRAITFGDALSMATGLDCDDDDGKSVGNEDHEQTQTAQADWYKLVLDAPLVRKPGTRAVYCSASTNLAGGAVAGVTGAWLPMYFEQRIAGPLHMQRYALNLMPTGQWYLGGGAYVRPRDFLKLGQLVLDHGRWRGRSIVDPQWIARSVRKRQTLGPGDDYGYAWHLRSYNVGAKTYRVIEAQGNGGQILDVLPDLDLAVMIMQGNYNNFLTWGKTRDMLMRKIIAATRAAA